MHIPDLSLPSTVSQPLSPSPGVGQRCQHARANRKNVSQIAVSAGMEFAVVLSFHPSYRSLYVLYVCFWGFLGCAGCRTDSDFKVRLWDGISAQSQMDQYRQALEIVKGRKKPEKADLLEKVRRQHG